MTQKQRIAAKEMVENGGTTASAMRKAGYSAAMVKNPQKLIKSKGFIETLELMGLSEERLAKVLDDGLDATKTVVMGTKSNESFVDIQPDFAVRHKYLETALRLRGYGVRYNTDSAPITANNSVIIYRPEKLPDNYSAVDSK